MSTLIAELKREILDDNISVSALLRKALIVAKEIKDTENEKWITSELKGYSDHEELPEYRNLSGRPVFRDHYGGWQYVYTQNIKPDIVKKISSFHFDAPISDFESSAKEELVATTYQPEAEQMLIRALGGKTGIPAVQFTGSQFSEVLNIVRNRILEWISTIQTPEEEPARAQQETSAEVRIEKRMI